MYADDTTLTSTVSNFRNNSNSVETSINAELLKINDWLQINKLSLNIAKSKFMIFQKIDKEMEVLTLKVDNMNIERVKEFNFYRFNSRCKFKLEKTHCKSFKCLLPKKLAF